VATSLETQCCVVGGGPAGTMLALLLARQGLDVVVLEKHPDFLRDYRGDNIHPSTMEVLQQVGLIEAFLGLGPDRAEVLVARTAQGSLTLADFRLFRSPYQFMATLPQWEYLAFITREAARFPGFHLMMNARAIGLLDHNCSVAGVRYASPAGEGQIRALVTVAADGRTSTLRALAGLTVVKTFPSIDMLMFRLPRTANAPDVTGMSVGEGHVVISISRGDYYQMAYTIEKGGDGDFRSGSIDRLRNSVQRLAPQVAAELRALQSWDQVSTLSIQADRLRRWYRPGLLCIGDAAHAMSPVGGVGINLAIQDAVVAANVLVGPLRRGQVSTRHLAAVQRKRAWQVRIMQIIQERSTRGALLASEENPTGIAGLVRRLGRRIIVLKPVVAIGSRVVGVGIRRVHVSREVAALPVAGARSARGTVG